MLCLKLVDMCYNKPFKLLTVTIVQVYFHFVFVNYQLYLALHYDYDVDIPDRYLKRYDLQCIFQCHVYKPFKPADWRDIDTSDHVFDIKKLFTHDVIHSYQLTSTPSYMTCTLPLTATVRLSRQLISNCNIWWSVARNQRRDECVIEPSFNLAFKGNGTDVLGWMAQVLTSIAMCLRLATPAFYMDHWASLPQRQQSRCDRLIITIDWGRWPWEWVHAFVELFHLRAAWHHCLVVSNTIVCLIAFTLDVGVSKDEGCRG